MKDNYIDSNVYFPNNIVQLYGRKQILYNSASCEAFEYKLGDLAEWDEKIYKKANVFLVVKSIFMVALFLIILLELMMARSEHEKLFIMSILSKSFLFICCIIFCIEGIMIFNYFYSGMKGVIYYKDLGKKSNVCFQSEKIKTILREM